MWLLLLFIGASSAFAEATVQRFDGEKVYRVTPRNEDEVHALNYLANIMQVDFWRPDSVELVKAEMTVDFRIEAGRHSEVESILQHHGLNYEILIDNLQTALDRQLDNRARTVGYQYEKYNKWEKIDAWTADIANENPNLVSRIQIGTTFEGRPMPLLKIGKPGENKKAIFIDCGFHAREWISPAFCQWFVREAVRTYGKETIMTRLLNDLDFYVLPVLNIDGYVYSWTKSRMWRKTRSVNAGSSCIGTDPNRNFDAAWCTVDSSRNPCSETYCGSKAESEKETKALADFIRRNRSTIKAYLTIHSYSQMLLYPYSYTYKLIPNNVELNSIAKGAIRELATLYGTEYAYGPGATTIWLLFTPLGRVLVHSFDSDKVFRVKLENENQLNVLKDLASTIQLDFWHPHSVQHVLIGKNVDFRVSSDQTNFVQKILEQNQIQNRIVFHNLQDEIEKQLDGGKHFRKKHFYTRYNEWEKIAAWTRRMAKKHAKLISRIEIGKTYEERPMYVLKVGKQSNPKKAIFMDCGIHAREWISPAFCQWFVKEAVTTYGRDKDMTLLLDNLNFYVLPVFNVDGYVWTWTKDRMWRKNRSSNSNSDCIGTDLNRNFNAAWGSDKYKGSHDPCEPIYCGSSAESEPETKAVTTFIRAHLASIKGYITIHAYSQKLLFPYGYTKEEAPTHDKLNELAKEAVDALHSLYQTEYTYGSIATTIYPCSGNSIDWAYDEGIKYSFGFEVRDYGQNGFLLPESQIKPTCKETMLAIKVIAKQIVNNAQ